jgi:hypothetical protein
LDEVGIFVYDRSKCFANITTGRQVGLKFVLDKLPGYVFFPAVLVGYGGYSLDLLYKRLRKRTQGAA